MSQSQLMRRLAMILRRNPWAVVAAKRVYGLTRPHFTMGVVGVLFNSRGQVLMVEHVFHPYLPWGLPGGWVERNEHPGDSLRRELREELTIEAEIGAILVVDNFEPHHLDLAYLCRGPETVGPLSFELLGCQWVEPDQLPPTHEFHRLAIQRGQAMRALELRA